MTDTVLRCFELPAWTLRKQRQRGRRDPEEFPDHVVGAGADSGACLVRPGDAGVPVRAELLHVHPAGIRRTGFGADEIPLAATLRGGWIAIAARVGPQVEVRLFDEQELVPRAQITMSGAKRAAIRLGDDTLTIADDRGRVFVLDLAYGFLVRDLRV